MEKFWMVWRAESRAVGVMHKSFESALTEAQRLAGKERIGTFVVLEAVSIIGTPMSIDSSRNT